MHVPHHHLVRPALRALGHQVWLAEVSYTFWYDLCLLRTRIEALGRGAPTAAPHLRRAGRALTRARLAMAVRWGHGAVRELERSRRELLCATRRLPVRTPVGVQIAGHLEGLPHIWSYAAGFPAPPLAGDRP
ncbi:hypothetical protein ACWGJ2_05520 [Streptomyces sp. NPDC054796]